MSTNDTIANLVALTARLVDLMGREIELLRAMRPREIEGIQAEKAALARTYAETVRQLSADPQRLKALEPVVRDEIKRVTERFEEAVAENARALKAASEAIYRSMMAEEFGRIAARSGGVGIADAVHREMLRMQEIRTP